MEKRVSYYVSRKSFLVWLSALVMTASAALRIAYSCGKGADASTVWFQIVLPVAACLIFVLMILLGGEERFYRTAIPAFMLAIYYSVRVSAVLPSLSLRFVFWVAYLAMAGLYAVTVSGRLRNNWVLVLLLAAAIAVLAYTHRIAFTSGNWSGRVGFLPELLFLTGGFFAVLAMQPHADGKYHPTWGDRVDGRKLRTLEKTLESIPKAGRRIPGWATFVMPGSCSPKSPGHRKRSDLSYPSSSRSTGRMGRTTPQSWRTGSTSRHRTSHTALTSATAILLIKRR